MDAKKCSECDNKEQNRYNYDNICFYYCGNENAPKGHSKILSCCNFINEESPTWCPLRE